MFLILKVVTVFIVSVAMSLALAHALEMPGKMRLDRESYIVVQGIYYPGFTFGGLAEILGIISTMVLLLTTSTTGGTFWWIAVGLSSLVAMHAVYWLVTHNVNKYWLKSQELKGAGAAFFSLGPGNQDKMSEEGTDVWKRMRDKWEYSHLVRAVLSVIALLALIIAIAITN